MTFPPRGLEQVTYEFALPGSNGRNQTNEKRVKPWTIPRDYGKE